MDNGKKVTVWVAGFAGVFLLYSAFKNHTPLSQFTSFLHAGQTPTAIAPASTAASPTGSAAPSSTSGTTSHIVSASYVADMGGEPYVFDGNGNPIRQVPAVYAQNPGLYVPGNVSA